MGELLNKIQTTLAAVDDIEKAIQERGIVTEGYTLLEYGDLIRRIVGEGGLLYPQYATLLLKRITKVPTFVAEIHNQDSYEGVFTSPIEWFITDAGNVFNFRNEILTCETLVVEKTDKNTKTAIFTSTTNELVELIEITE